MFLIKYLNNFALAIIFHKPIEKKTMILWKNQCVALLCKFEDKYKNLLFRLGQCKSIRDILIHEKILIIYLIDILYIASYKNSLENIILNVDSINLPVEFILDNFRSNNNPLIFDKYIYLLTLIVEKIIIYLEILLHKSKYISRVSLQFYLNNKIIGKKFILLKKEDINSYLIFVKVISTPLFSRKRLKPNLSQDLDLVQYLRERLDNIFAIIIYKYLPFEEIKPTYRSRLTIKYEK